MHSASLSLIALVCVIYGSNGQQGMRFVFPWPGPVQVPVDINVIETPDTVTIQFSDGVNGTQRVLRIGEGVFATFDCSLVADSLISLGVSPDAVEDATWTVRKYDVDNVPAADVSPIDEDIDDDPYDIGGTNLVILNITNPVIPTIAAEGETGEYNCEICGTPFSIGTTPTRICLNATTTLLVEGNPPVIDRSTDGGVLAGFPRYHIGNDVCFEVDSPPQQGFDILCLLDTNFDVPVDPPPVATWSFRGMTLTTGGVFTVQDDFDAGIGTDGLVTIEPVVPTDPYVGVYMCNLTNDFGMDTATTIFAVRGISMPVSIAGVSGDGCSRFGVSNDDGNLVCVSMGESVTIDCSASLGFTLSGPGGQSTDEALVITVNSSNTGLYVCDSGHPCNDTTSRIISIVVVGPPDIVEGPEVIEGDNFRQYNIGTDICILPANPLRIRIACGHDNSNPLSSVPMAAWTIPSILTTPPESGGIQFIDNPDRFGTNDLLIIDNDGDPIEFTADIVGTYTCNLSNSDGFDISTTNINISPNINIGSGQFDLDPDEGRVTIGNSTCVTRRGDPSQPRVGISCRPSTGTFTTMWFYNGELLPSETGPILAPNQGSGEYTCVISNACGSLNETSTILGTPDIATPGAPPTDSPNVVYDVGQDVCADTTVGGNILIQCPLPMFADPTFTTVEWTKEGDNSFSFTGSNLSLPRNDLNSAGNYTCTILSGPSGACGIDSETSTVSFQTQLTTDSGIDSDTSDGVVIGADACLPNNGDALQIRCQTTPTTSVSWTHNGSLIAGGELLDVTIPGIYTCTVSDGCGGQLNATSQIFGQPDVVISGTIIGRNDSGCSRFTDAPAEAGLCPVPGDVVIIQCTSSLGEYSIIANGILTTTNNPAIFPSFADDNAGLYVCLGEDENCGIDTDQLLLFAGGIPPRLRELLVPSIQFFPDLVATVGQDVCLPFGETVGIDCTPNGGTPPFTYAWTTAENSSLVISTSAILNVTELGTYQCTVSNRLGSDTASSTIVEDIELVFNISTSSMRRSRCDQFNVVPPGVDFCFFTGDSIELSCFTRFSMTPGLIEPASENGTVIIDELTEFDDVFTCFAENGCGNDTASVVILVQEPARIDRLSILPPSSDSEFNVGVGRPDDPVIVERPNVTVRLHCPFTGIDDPVTKWVIVNDDRTVVDVQEMPPNVVFVNESGNIILVLNNFTESSEGTYRCVTNNNAGDDRADIVLRFDPPEEGNWTTTQWSECDPNCHRGMRMRMVTCRGVNTGYLLPDNRCTEVKPLTMEQCIDRGPCFLDPQWVAKDWEPCSAECGGGSREREVQCIIPRTNKRVSYKRCDELQRPRSFEYCNLHRCCKDEYPNYCPLLRGTVACSFSYSKQLCCWSCR